MPINNITSNCPHCGAPIEIDEYSQAFMCRFCSSIIAIDKTMGVNNSQTSALRAVEPERKYYGTYYPSYFKQQGGFLILTKDEIAFKPHFYNLYFDSHYIPIQDIVGYKKGFLTLLNILRRDGTEIRLAVYRKNEIINEIEKRRVNYFRSRGLSVPELQCGREYIRQS